MKRMGTTQTAKNKSVWQVGVTMPRCRRLSSDITTEVCIVGGGIAGLTTAYLLGRMGTQVVVLEDGGLVSGMSAVTSAHLSNAIDDGFVEIERWHGVEGARLAAESHGAAIDCIEDIVGELGVDCEFERLDGYLFLAPGHNPERIGEELASAHRAGLFDAELVACAPLDFDTGPCIRFPQQARFHPRKYLAALARAIKDQGGKIYTHSHADVIEGGDVARIEVGPYTVSADAVVVATNTPVNDLVALHTKQAAYMTYVIGARVPRGSVADALYWDTLKAYHYIRLQEPEVNAEGHQADYQLLIIGGEDHKTGQPEHPHDPHARLEAWARARFPMIGTVEFKWGGQCMETIDGLAFIGRNPLDKENVYVVTGDSGMGLTHGTIAGMLLTDLIQGRQNPWANLYDPARKTLLAADTFVKEQVNVAAQYTDWVTPGEVSMVDEIEPWSGAVLRRGISKVAVYKDGHGKIHEMSAVCPHLKCIVNWNTVESTWDCPCHGSRFDCHGKVINGPANSDLSPVQNDNSDEHA